MTSPSKLPLVEKSPNIVRARASPTDSPVLKRPSILGPPPVFSNPEGPLTTSHLAAPLAGGAKRKLPETGLKPPAPKRITLADRAAAPKQLAAKPSMMTRSVTTDSRLPARNPLSSTVGPGTRPTNRPIAVAKSRVVSAGLSKSVGPGSRVTRATPGPNRPVSRGSESSRSPSREGIVKNVAAKAKRPAWDTKGRLEDMELAYQELRERLEGTTSEKDNMNELLTSERARCISLELRYLIIVMELETSRARLQVEKEQLQNELRESERRKGMSLKEYN